MISIVITTYNVEKYIETAIKSAFNQTFKDIEVVVVDDCSTDSTESIINKFKNVKLIKNEKNMGPGWARKIGIDNSKGEYILFLDADDWLDSNYIEKLYEESENGSIDIISGGVTIHESDGYRVIATYADIELDKENRIKRFFTEKVPFMNNKLIKRKLYKKVSYCTRRYIEDTPTYIPILYYANRIKYVRCSGYHYNKREGSLTTFSNKVRDNIFQALCVMDLIKFFKNKKFPKIFTVNTFLNHAIAALKSSEESLEEFRNTYPCDWLDFVKFYNCCVKNLK